MLKFFHLLIFLENQKQKFINLPTYYPHLNPKQAKFFHLPSFGAIFDYNRLFNLNSTSFHENVGRKSLKAKTVKPAKRNFEKKIKLSISGDISNETLPT